MMMGADASDGRRKRLVWLDVNRHALAHRDAVGQER